MNARPLRPERSALPTEPRKRFEPYYIMIPEAEGFVKRKMKVHAVCYESPSVQWFRKSLSSGNRPAWNSVNPSKLAT